MCGPLPTADQAYSQLIIKNGVSSLVNERWTAPTRRPQLSPQAWCVPPPAADQAPSWRLVMEDFPEPSKYLGEWTLNSSLQVHCNNNIRKEKFLSWSLNSDWMIRNQWSQSRTWWNSEKWKEGGVHRLYQVILLQDWETALLSQYFMKTCKLKSLPPPPQFDVLDSSKSYLKHIQ